MDVFRDLDPPSRGVVIVIGREEGDDNLTPEERLLRLAVDLMATGEADTT